MASAILLGSFILSRGVAAQAPTGTVRGQLVATWTKGAGFRVALQGTKYRTTADSAGRFVFANVPASSYALEARLPQGAPVVRAIVVAPGETLDVVIELPATAVELAPVVVIAARPLHVIGHLPQVHDGVIYSGKKTELIQMDSLKANTAQDLERQILGRVPGANFSETEGAGFPSNGVGFRGLDPTQSVEVNTRQNGVNIAADVFGYPETYYTPPSEALQRIEVVRGAGSLAFGPQIGGVVNYVVRAGEANTGATVTSAQTTGSFGLANSFNSISGGAGRWTYYGFAHYRTEEGWRPNSNNRQGAAYASATYRASDRLTLGGELTLFRNRIHMPGGLSDEQFATDPSKSFRARNWLASPWNIGVLRARYELTPNARIETVASAMSSQRYLVWRNEHGGAGSPDAIDPATGEYVSRELEHEKFTNVTLESRLRVDHSLLGRPATLASGVRLLAGRMRRLEGGEGSTGSDFDMSLQGGSWERSLRFATTNLALFAEELVRLTERFSVTPGVRVDHVRSSATGYTDVDSVFAPRTFTKPLFGLGLEYAAFSSTALYANVSEAYRPILYASLTPLGSITRVDRNLRTARGYNVDLGWRGNVSDALKFDVGMFYLLYRDRIGTRTVHDSGAEFSETANIGNSVHRGVEVYAEVDPFSLSQDHAQRLGAVDVFVSFAYVDARYVSGQFAHNRVELAPRVLSRTGLTYGLGPFATTLQASYTSSSFGDANNSILPTEDEVAGFVPSYTVLDLSTKLKLGNRYILNAGINNLANAKYFTKRTGEYPGPGILPGIARRAYAGVSASF